jgi:hypothetical protein
MGATDFREGKKGVTMGTSPSNLAEASDASAHANLPGEPGRNGTCVRAETVGAAQCNLLSAADDIGKEQVQATTNRRMVTAQGDEYTKLETNIRSPQGAPEAWCLPRCLQLRAVPGLPSVDASMHVPNSSSFEPLWVPTPALRRPSDRLSNRTKFLIASAIIAPLAGYFGVLITRSTLRSHRRPQYHPFDFCHA